MKVAFKNAHTHTLAPATLSPGVPTNTRGGGAARWKLNNWKFNRKFENYIIWKLNRNWNREISRSCSVFRHFFFYKIWENPSKLFVKISENRDEIWTNCKKFSISNVENAKQIDKLFLKYWGLRGAKACKSSRSRQELSNEYLVFACEVWLRYSRERVSQSLFNSM